MHFDLTDLRLFLHVAEAGSITAGAARSGLALASASARVRGMEEQSGVALLERGRRGVEPTPAGRALLHHARLVAQQIERMRGELGEYARGLKGHVRLLANTAAMAEFLPEALAAFLAANPNVDIDLDERPSTEVARSVAEGLADAGVAADHADLSGLECFPFRADRLVLAVPPGHPLHGRGRSPSPKRSGASSWACPATARSNVTSPGTRRARAAGCGCASGCAGWTRPAAWRRSARGRPWCPRRRRAAGRAAARSASCGWTTPGRSGGCWWWCGASTPCPRTRGGSRCTSRRPSRADRARGPGPPGNEAAVGVRRPKRRRAAHHARRRAAPSARRPACRT